MQLLRERMVSVVRAYRVLETHAFVFPKSFCQLILKRLSATVGPQPRTGVVELLREQSIYELRLDLGLFRIY